MSIRNASLVCCVLVGSLTQLSSKAARAQDWPQWRGPERNGSAPAFEAPARWPDSLQLVWRIEVGAGLSSPVVVDSSIFLLTRDQNDEVVSCFASGDGHLVWRQRYPSLFFANPQAASPNLFPVSQGRGPFATPAVRNGSLYTLGVERILSCFDTHSGEMNWQRQFFKQNLPDKIVYVCPPCGCSEDGKTFESPGSCTACNMIFSVRDIETTAQSGGSNYYGAASSPLVRGEIGVVYVGNAEHGSLIAFDPHTGESRWEWQGPGISSSSPMLATLHGVEQIIVITRVSVAGIAAAEGRLLWNFPLESNAQIVTPLVNDDLVIFATYRGPLTAIQIKREGSGWHASEHWKNSELSLETSTPIIVEDKLFGFFYSNRGQFASVEAASGQTIWESEGRLGRGASWLHAGNVLLALTNEGALFVLDPSEVEFAPVARYELADSPIWASPVAWGDKLLVKDESSLSLWRLE